MNIRHIHDVAVVGAGSAGLQAAQTLGRMHRSTVVLGTDRYRNDPAQHMHNFLGHDGTPPAELRVAGREDAGAYADVRFLDAEVTRISGELGDFVLEVAGEEPVHAARVILAAGVRDTLRRSPAWPSSSATWSHTARSATATSSPAPASASSAPHRMSP